MITLYVRSAPECPHCVRAKAYLDEFSIPYEVKDIVDPEHRAFFDERGHTHIPQIYVGDTLLVEGGATALIQTAPEVIRMMVEDAQLPMVA